MPFDFNPSNFKRFSARVTDNAQRTTREVAEEAAGAFADKVMEVMNFQIETSVTPTGQKRAETKGGHPGRIDSGKMIDSISHEIQTTGTITTARAGYLIGAEPYMLLQDQGTANIQASHALVRGFDEGVRAAREVLNRRWGR